MRTGRQRDVCALAVLFLVFFVVGCAGTPNKSYTKQQLVQMPEWQMLDKRLNVYRKLVCKCKPDAWKLGIIRSGKVNAFNAGQGRFFVTEGLLRIPFEEQDAALAHEVGHEVMGHVGKRQAASVVMTGVFIVLGAFIPGAELLDHVVNPLVVAAYSKEQELEADSIAVYLLQSTYNDKSAGKRLQALLQRLQSQKGASGGGLFATHPHPKERIAEIGKMVRGEKQAQLPPVYVPDDAGPGAATGTDGDESSDSNKPPGDL